jgi:hypothetical protein
VIAEIRKAKGIYREGRNGAQRSRELTAENAGIAEHRGDGNEIARERTSDKKRRPASHSMAGITA